MRLGQLARKIAIKPSELVEFLTTKNIATESGINTKLEAAHVHLIVQALAPKRMAEIMTESTVQQEPEVMIEPKNVVKPVIEFVEPEPKAILPAIFEVLTPKQDKMEEPEIIKVPKVELQGLKVLGKIELPETKKKEPVVDSSESIEPEPVPMETTVIALAVVNREQPFAKRTSIPQRRERTEQRLTQNPIALQREQEAIEAQRKRKGNAELEKEKRTQNYLKRVKSAPTKAMKRMDDQVIEEIEADEVKPPKTWLGKLFRWFKS